MRKQYATSPVTGQVVETDPSALGLVTRGAPFAMYVGRGVPRDEALQLNLQPGLANPMGMSPLGLGAQGVTAVTNPGTQVRLPESVLATQRANVEGGILKFTPSVQFTPEEGAYLQKFWGTPSDHKTALTVATRNGGAVQAKYEALHDLVRFDPTVLDNQAKLDKFFKGGWSAVGKSAIIKRVRQDLEKSAYLGFVEATGGDTDSVLRNNYLDPEFDETEARRITSREAWAATGRFVAREAALGLATEGALIGGGALLSATGVGAIPGVVSAGIGVLQGGARVARATAGATRLLRAGGWLGKNVIVPTATAMTANTLLRKGAQKAGVAGFEAGTAESDYGQMARLNPALPIAASTLVDVATNPVGIVKKPGQILRAFKRGTQPDDIIQGTAGMLGGAGDLTRSQLRALIAQQTAVNTGQALAGEALNAYQGGEFSGQEVLRAALMAPLLGRGVVDKTVGDRVMPKANAAGAKISDSLHKAVRRAGAKRVASRLSTRLAGRAAVTPTARPVAPATPAAPPTVVMGAPPAATPPTPANTGAAAAATPVAAPPAAPAAAAPPTVAPATAPAAPVRPPDDLSPLPPNATLLAAVNVAREAQAKADEKAAKAGTTTGVVTMTTSELTAGLGGTVTDKGAVAQSLASLARLGLVRRRREDSTTPIDGPTDRPRTEIVRNIREFAGIAEQATAAGDTEMAKFAKDREEMFRRELAMSDAKADADKAEVVARKSAIAADLAAAQAGGLGPAEAEAALKVAIDNFATVRANPASTAEEIATANRAVTRANTVLRDAQITSGTGTIEDLMARMTEYEAESLERAAKGVAYQVTGNGKVAIDYDKENQGATRTGVGVLGGQPTVYSIEKAGIIANQFVESVRNTNAKTTKGGKTWDNLKKSRTPASEIDEVMSNADDILAAPSMFISEADRELIMLASVGAKGNAGRFAKFSVSRRSVGSGESVMLKISIGGTGNREIEIPLVQEGHGTIEVKLVGPKDVEANGDFTMFRKGVLLKDRNEWVQAKAKRGKTGGIEGSGRVVAQENEPTETASAPFGVSKGGDESAGGTRLYELAGNSGLKITLPDTGDEAKNREIENEVERVVEDRAGGIVDRIVESAAAMLRDMRAGTGESGPSSVRDILKARGDTDEERARSQEALAQLEGLGSDTGTRRAAIMRAMQPFLAELSRSIKLAASSGSGDPNARPTQIKSMATAKWKVRTDAFFSPVQADLAQGLMAEALGLPKRGVLVGQDGTALSWSGGDEIDIVSGSAAESAHVARVAMEKLLNLDEITNHPGWDSIPWLPKDGGERNAEARQLVAEALKSSHEFVPTPQQMQVHREKARAIGQATAWLRSQGKSATHADAVALVDDHTRGGNTLASYDPFRADRIKALEARRRVAQGLRAKVGEWIAELARVGGDTEAPDVRAARILSTLVGSARADNAARAAAGEALGNRLKVEYTNGNEELKALFDNAGLTPDSRPIEFTDVFIKSEMQSVVDSLGTQDAGKLQAAVEAFLLGESPQLRVLGSNPNAWRSQADAFVHGDPVLERIALSVREKVGEKVAETGDWRTASAHFPSEIRKAMAGQGLTPQQVARLQAWSDALTPKVGSKMGEGRGLDVGDAFITPADPEVFGDHDLVDLDSQPNTSIVDGRTNDGIVVLHADPGGSLEGGNVNTAVYYRSPLSKGPGYLLLLSPDSNVVTVKHGARTYRGEVSKRHAPDGLSTLSPAGILQAIADSNNFVDTTDDRSTLRLDFRDDTDLAANAQRERDTSESYEAAASSQDNTRAASSVWEAGEFVQSGPTKDGVARGTATFPVTTKTGVPLTYHKQVAAFKHDKTPGIVWVEDPFTPGDHYAFRDNGVQWENGDDTAILDSKGRPLMARLGDNGTLRTTAPVPVLVRDASGLWKVTQKNQDAGSRLVYAVKDGEVVATTAARAKAQGLTLATGEQVVNAGGTAPPTTTTARRGTTLTPPTAPTGAGAHAALDVPTVTTPRQPPTTAPRPRGVANLFAQQQRAAVAEGKLAAAAAATATADSATPPSAAEPAPKADATAPPTVAVAPPTPPAAPAAPAAAAAPVTPAAPATRRKPVPPGRRAAPPTKATLKKKEVASENKNPGIQGAKAVTEDQGDWDAPVAAVPDRLPSTEKLAADLGRGLGVRVVTTSSLGRRSGAATATERREIYLPSSGYSLASLGHEAGHILSIDHGLYPALAAEMQNNAALAAEVALLAKEGTKAKKAWTPDQVAMHQAIEAIGAWFEGRVRSNRIEGDAPEITALIRSLVPAERMASIEAYAESARAYVHNNGARPIDDIAGNEVVTPAARFRAFLDRAKDYAMGSRDGWYRDSWFDVLRSATTRQTHVAERRYAEMVRRGLTDRDPHNNPLVALKLMQHTGAMLREAMDQGVHDRYGRNNQVVQIVDALSSPLQGITDLAGGDGARWDQLMRDASDYTKRKAAIARIEGLERRLATLRSDLQAEALKRGGGSRARLRYLRAEIRTLTDETAVTNAAARLKGGDKEAETKALQAIEARATPEELAAYKVMSDGINKISDQLIDMAVAYGRYSKEQGDAIKASSDSFASMTRVREDEDSRTTYNRRARGGTGETEGPYEALINNAHHAMREAMRNKTVGLFVEPLRLKQGPFEKAPENLDLGRVSRLNSQGAWTGPNEVHYGRIPPNNPGGGRWLSVIDSSSGEPVVRAWVRPEDWQVPYYNNGQLELWDFTPMDAVGGRHLTEKGGQIVGSAGRLMADLINTFGDVDVARAGAFHEAMDWSGLRWIGWVKDNVERIITKTPPFLLTQYVADAGNQLVRSGTGVFGSKSGEARASSRRLGLDGTQEVVMLGNRDRERNSRGTQARDAVRRSATGWKYGIGNKARDFALSAAYKREAQAAYDEWIAENPGDESGAELYAYDRAMGIQDGRDAGYLFRALSRDILPFAAGMQDGARRTVEAFSGKPGSSVGPPAAAMIAKVLGVSMMASLAEWAINWLQGEDALEDIQDANETTRANNFLIKDPVGGGLITIPKPWLLRAPTTVVGDALAMARGASAGDEAGVWSRSVAGAYAPAFGRDPLAGSTVNKLYLMTKGLKDDGRPIIGQGEAHVPVGERTQSLRASGLGRGVQALSGDAIDGRVVDAVVEMVPYFGALLTTASTAAAGDMDSARRLPSRLGVPYRPVDSSGSRSAGALRKAEGVGGVPTNVGKAVKFMDAQVDRADDFKGAAESARSRRQFSRLGTDIGRLVQPSQRIKRVRGVFIERATRGL